jgi:hypothetical protein
MAKRSDQDGSGKHGGLYAFRAGYAESKRGFCVVQSKISTPVGITVEAGVTATEYGTFQDGYDYLNVALFDGSLSQVLITLQRHGGKNGYVSTKKFQRRGAATEHVHELALNPDSFPGRTDEEILSDLAHNMVHVWQNEHGDPGRGRYHNRQWAKKMHSIGLMPSSTGSKGGAVTGDSVSHYILDGGRFSVACRAFLWKYRLVWEPARSDASGSSNESSGKAETWRKFTCPNCELIARSKPSARIDCHDCSVDAKEPVLMLSNQELESGAIAAGERQDQGADEEYDRVIGIMTKAMQAVAKDDVCLEEFLPALVDFTCAVALGVAGEKCLRAFITRMTGRIDDWRAGTFPVDDTDGENDSSSRE